MRILVIEDNSDLAGFLEKGLEEEMFVVDVVGDGEKGSELARMNNYDLVILDVMLPGKSGREVCEEIRESGKMTPIIILTVCTEMPEKVSLFSCGADDYLVKPFAFAELLARMRAVLRRPRGLASQTVMVDDLVLDTVNKTVSRGKQEIILTAKEFAILECLMRNSERVVGRTMLIDEVWNRDEPGLSRSLETHVLNLRKKINIGNKRRLLVTVAGRGYRI